MGGSNVGGLKETQGMLNFAAKHSSQCRGYSGRLHEHRNGAFLEIQLYRLVIDVGNTMKAA